MTEGSVCLQVKPAWYTLRATDQPECAGVDLGCTMSLGEKVKRDRGIFVRI